MPFLGLLTNGINYTNIFFVLKEGITEGAYETLAEAKEAGAITVNIGIFISSILTFFLIAMIFFLLLRSISRLYQEPEESRVKKASRQEVLLEEIRDSIRSQDKF